MVVYETISALTARIEKDEVADVAIVSQPQIESLIKKGIIDAAGTVSVAKFSVGIAVRKRAPKPDISTVEGFKRSLLAAKSIGYNDPATGSPAGVHIAKIIERLGLAADLRTKIKLNSGSQPTFEALANGDIEIGFAIVSQILEGLRVDLVAPLPAGIQDITVLTAGLVETTKESEAGKALISFVSSPTATAVYKAKGLGLD
jgi:molybdate transport system substrate-binding protein